MFRTDDSTASFIMHVWLLMTTLCLVGLCSADNHETTVTPDPTTTPPVASVKVLIVGAGMAGLSAARMLEQGGMKDFVVLEGSGRVGGRIRHSTLGGFPVEHGAMWIHGGEENPLHDLARQFNVSLFYDDFEDYVCRNEKGDDVTETLDEAYEVFGHALEMRDKKSQIMLELQQPDMNQRAYFQRAGWFAKTPEEFVAEVFDIDFDYAFPPSEISTKYPGEYTYYDFEDEDYVTLSPYSAVPQGLADEMFSENDSTKRLFLDTIVSEIHQDEDQVTVVTKDGRTFEAEQVIVAVSLGVLQNNLMQFEPDLPDWKWDSIQAFQFAHYLNFYLYFPDAFWDDNQYILYASTTRGRYTVWQNLNKLMPGSNVIQANVIQYEAERLLKLSDEEIQADAMVVLREIYGESIPHPSDIVVPRFGTDPLFMGSYSNWPPGYTHDMFRSLQARVGRVHFAGEHTSFRYFGYVHGALLSGEEVAGDTLDCLDNNKKACTDYVPPYEAYGCMYSAATNHEKGAQLDDGSCKFQQCPSNSSGHVSLRGWALVSLVILAIVFHRM